MRAFLTSWCDWSDESRILTGSVMFIYKYTSCIRNIINNFSCITLLAICKCLF